MDPDVTENIVIKKAIRQSTCVQKLLDFRVELLDISGLFYKLLSFIILLELQFDNFHF